MRLSERRLINYLGGKRPWSPCPQLMPLQISDPTAGLNLLFSQIAAACLGNSLIKASLTNFGWLVETRAECWPWWGFSDYYSLVVRAPEAILQLPVSCSEVTAYTRATAPREWSVYSWQWLHPYTQRLTCLSDGLPMSSRINFILLLVKWHLMPGQFVNSWIAWSNHPKTLAVSVEITVTHTLLLN